MVPREGDQRSSLALGVAALVLVPWLFYVGLYLGNNRCGGDGYPAPVEGSPRESYCSVFVKNGGDGAWLLNLLFYLPVPLLVIGGAWALCSGRHRALYWVIAAALAWPLIYAAPAVLLSGN